MSVLLYSAYLDSPVGSLKLVFSDDALHGILWESEVTQHPMLAHAQPIEQHTFLDVISAQLLAYFEAKTQAFNLPIQLTGTTFQQRVWQALQGIDYAKTCSYSDIAHIIGQPQAVRAVGTAIGRNPISIVVPCHRVIGKNGKLTGFAGGLTNKQYLLNLEQHHTK